MTREFRIESFNVHEGFGIPEVDEAMGDYLIDRNESDEEGDERKFPKDENDTEDRISKLPDDALQLIISPLKMRERAATSILSKRWRNLWRRSAARLEFTDSSLFGHRHPTNLVELEEKRHNSRTNKNRFPQPRRPRRKGVVETERARFVNLVNHILALRSAKTMDKLSLRFPLGTESATHLDRWMKLAAAQGVTKLELDLDWTYFDYFDWQPNNKYIFHVQRFGSSLKHMYLNFCVFKFPPHFQGLISLVYLDLFNCFLTSSDVQNMLSKCPSLKWLSFRDCEFPNSTILEFVGPSIPIKHLHISDPKNIQEIKLQDVNLLSCELMVADEKISIKNIQHLIRLVLHTEGNVEILGRIRRLETLLLKHKYSIRKLKLPDLSALKHLRHMEFSVNENVSNLFEVLSLLKTFPLLKRIEIDMGDFNKSYSEPSELSARVATTPGCLHSNLREVMIYAFESHPELIDLTQYLLKNAVTLRKMRIDTTCLSYVGNGLWCCTENGKLVGTRLKEVSKLLKKEARPSTKLLIRSK